MTIAALFSTGFSPGPQHNPDVRDQTTDASLDAPFVRFLRLQATAYRIALFYASQRIFKVLPRIWCNNLHRYVPTPGTYLRERARADVICFVSFHTFKLTLDF